MEATRAAVQAVAMIGIVAVEFVYLSAQRHPPGTDPAGVTADGAAHEEWIIDVVLGTGVAQQHLNRPFGRWHLDRLQRGAEVVQAHVEATFS